MPTGPVVYRESRQLDGIDYEITVRSMAGGFYGAWLCGACGASGVNPMSSNTEEDAAAKAPRGIIRIRTRRWAAFDRV